MRLLLLLVQLLLAVACPADAYNFDPDFDGHHGFRGHVLESTQLDGMVNVIDSKWPP